MVQYLDGTFKVVKQPFYQLLSIHCFFKNEDCMKQFPLCFVIMSGKSSKDYTAVLKAVTEILPATPSVSSFVVDFEAGLWKGIRSVFNDTGLCIPFYPSFVEKGSRTRFANVVL